MVVIILIEVVIYIASYPSEHRSKFFYIAEKIQIAGQFLTCHLSLYTFAFILLHILDIDESLQGCPMDTFPFLLPSHLTKRATILHHPTVSNDKTMMLQRRTILANTEHFEYSNLIFLDYCNSKRHRLPCF